MSMQELSQLFLYILIGLVSLIVIVAVTMVRRSQSNVEEPETEPHSGDQARHSNMNKQWLDPTDPTPDVPQEEVDGSYTQYYGPNRKPPIAAPLSPTPSSASQTPKPLTKKQLELGIREKFSNEILRQMQTGDVTVEIDREDAKKFLGIPVTIRSKQEQPMLEITDPEKDSPPEEDTGGET